MPLVGFTLLILIISIVSTIMVGLYVYRDSRQRNMNSALWVLISVLAPAYIGFIIYLIIRTGHSDLICPICNTTVTDQYLVCPNCGTRLKASCSNCGLTLNSEWNVCPGCAATITPAPDVFPPVRKQDRSLGKILLLLLLIPLLLIVIILIWFHFL